MKKSFLNLICSTIATSIILLAPHLTIAQNINRPNKVGPMGLQVNTLTGNLLVPRHDIYVRSRGFNLKLSFYYNSFNYLEDYGFGNGWSFMFGIKYASDTGSSKRIIQGSGREDHYKSLGSGNYQSPPGFYTVFKEYQAGKFSLKELDGTTWYFDNSTHKRITKMEEPNGNNLQFQYTDTLLTSITTSAGQALTLAYDEGRLSTITDAISTPVRTYKYAYDAAGNLTTATDALNNAITYSYLVNGPLKTVKDKNNNLVNIIYYNDFVVSELIGCNKRISFSYDSTTATTFVTDHMSSGINQVTKYQYKNYGERFWLAGISGNCCGFNTAFEFDAKGNRTKETDANGNIYEYTYDANGNILTIKDPLNGIISYTYTTEFNQVATITDYKGNLYTMAYDAKGNVTQLTEPGNRTYTATYNDKGDVLTATDTKGNVYNYSYDAVGNPTGITGPNGYSVSTVYDARGNLLSVTDARGNSESAEYDLMNRIKKITSPLNYVVHLTYDAEGNLTQIKNPNNETSSFNYDASNRVVKLTGSTGNQQQYRYDAMDNLTSWKNEVGNEWLFSYDVRNRLTNIKEPLNDQQALTYDANGNIKSLSTAAGQTLSYTYDAKNRLIGISDNIGNVGSFGYDANDNVTTISWGDGVNSSATYDNRNRLSKATDALGHTTTYQYDANGNVSSITDRNGFTKLYTYDGLNRIKTFTNNNGHTITVTHDSEGNITGVKDQNNQVTTYTYDAGDRVTQVTYPDGRFIELGYDNKGNIILKKLTDGSVINYQYDSLSRLTGRTLPDGQTINYGYDAFGRITTATNSTGTVTIAYDALNRISAENFDGRTVHYNYNTAGRTQTIIYPDSTVVIKNFDTRNRLLSIIRNGTLISSYQYNNQNRVIAKTYNNNISTQYQYDFANRLSALATSNSNIQNSTYAYNKQRNKTAINRLNAVSSSEQFTYDNGNRLINYKRGTPGGGTALENSYTYDAVGNRTAANLNGAATTYSTNNLNQVTGINGAQTTGFVYDGNGNLTYDGSFYKSYNAEGRLMKDSASPSNIITYQYDAIGRRIAKTTNGNPIKYTYAGLSQIEERDGITNTLQKQTVFRSFLSPVMMNSNGNNYYYHQNEMNSVEAITNTSGSVVERYAYDAYGKPAVYNAANAQLLSSATGNHFGFTGQEYDFTTGNYKFFYRNYSPVTGTFLQRDLIGYADGMGMYQYVGNNPANGVDILGLEDCKPKEKLSFETVAREQPLVLGWVQVTLDELGNTGFVLSVFEMPKTLAENAYRAQYLKAAANYATMGEAAFASQGLAKAGNGLTQAISNGNKVSGVLKASSALGKAGPVLGAVDLGVKTANYDRVLNDPASSDFDVMDAQSDIISSGGNLVGGLAVTGAAAAGSALAVPGAIVLGTLALGDVVVTGATGKGIKQHNYEWMYKKMWGASESEHEYYNWIKTFGLEDSEFLKEIYMQGKGDTYLRVHRGMGPKPQCPDDGTQKPRPQNPGVTKTTEVISSSDPNEIIGPDGYGEFKFVSVKERLPYTITYENDKSATAPAKFVKITTAIQPKMDASTFRLGSFGFNSLTFTIPDGTSSYYQRLDARDSLGLYVDVTAGYDQLNNQAFWEFQSIDPVTLLPPADPLKGFLLLQDTANQQAGHGFVNFSIKPKTNAVTGDTISAMANIIFDGNGVIATNRHKNMIDAVAPSSSIDSLPAVTPNTEINLQFAGNDDAGGSGIRSFTVYVSDNNGPVQLYLANFRGTDTTFKGLAEHQYQFYVAATDNVANTEELHLVGTVLITDGEEVICPGGSTTFESNITGTTYQWQVNNGAGFTNISNGSIYSGAATSNLSLTGVPTSFYAYEFRCVVNGSQTSNVRIIKFAMSWEGTVNTAWENAANWSCNSLPDANTDVLIKAGKERYPEIISNVIIRTLKTNLGTSVKVKSGANLTVIK